MLVVAFPLKPEQRVLAADIIGDAGEIAWRDSDVARRNAAHRPRPAGPQHREDLRPGEPALLASARLIQFMTAGVDFVPLSALSPGGPVAGNGGAYAAPMAEHALAIALVAAKRLLTEHANLARGAFNQFTPTGCWPVRSAASAALARPRPGSHAGSACAFTLSTSRRIR